MKKTMESLVLCGIYISVVYSVTTACPPPNCGPCKTWDSTKNECVSICTSSQCCTASGCATLNPNEVRTSETNQVAIPSSLTSSFAAALNQIKGVSGVTVSPAGGSLCTTRTKIEIECCKSGNPGSIEKIICYEGTTNFYASFGSADISIFDQQLFNVDLGFWLQAKAHVYCSVHVYAGASASGTIGLSDNPCTSESFAYGSLTVSGGVGVSSTAGAEACLYIAGIGGCAGLSAIATAELELTGTVSENQCGSPSGFSGGLHFTKYFCDFDLDYGSVITQNVAYSSLLD